MCNKLTRNERRNKGVRPVILFLRVIFSVSLLSLSLTLAGCADIGWLAGGRTQTFTGKDSLSIETPRTDMLDVVARVGKSMGFSVSSLDKEAGIISLSSGSSPMTMVLIGKASESRVIVHSKDAGKRLDITVFVSGNFGSGGQEAAMKLLKDFEARLLKEIGQ